MEENVCSKRKTRPAQRLYVPPAQRNKRQNDKKPHKQEEPPINPPENLTEAATDAHVENDQCAGDVLAASNRLHDKSVDLTEVKSQKSTNETENLVINIKSLRMGPEKLETEVDNEKEEMQRAIVNINRKSRPLIKHVNKTDVLQIDVVKPVLNAMHKKSPVKLAQVSNWEDLYNLDLEDDQDDTQSRFVYEDSNESEDDITIINPKMQELEHVIELYDFPASFKSQDIMQIYNDINKDMYIKWCDETHALLVLGSSMQAQRALRLRHDIIKARSMMVASAIAVQVALKSDLKPAMKRPPTSMQAARRMITTALGAKAHISREVQEREREALRVAKELKRAQRQNEKDAWEGNPRPSTA